MCEIAVRRALEMAGVAASELDGIFVVTVTLDELNFCHDAMLVHQRLGWRQDRVRVGATLSGGRSRPVRPTALIGGERKARADRGAEKG
jgi:hypothetical protein